jgi:cytosine deaminase
VKALTPAAQELADDGYLLLPAFAEPHAHLDKAFLAERVENTTGDLLGAILAMEAARDTITVADTIDRAERGSAFDGAERMHRDPHPRRSVFGGQVDIGRGPARSEEPAARAREIQVAVLAALSRSSASAAPTSARWCVKPLPWGVDVIGGCPHLEEDPAESNDTLLALAAEAGLPVDLHTDETLNPKMLALEDLAERVLATGFPHPVAASHCVSLSLQTEQRQREVAEKVAAAGISVIALPHTNLFLQGRDNQVAMPRAVTAVRALRSAGRHDRGRRRQPAGPLHPVGRADPLETAGLMIIAAHVLPDDALHHGDRCRAKRDGIAAHR